MEKYKLDSNIIITTRERYEKKFKALGYVPYVEEAKVEENATNAEQEADMHLGRAKRKRN